MIGNRSRQPIGGIHLVEWCCVRVRVVVRLVAVGVRNRRRHLSTMEARVVARKLERFFRHRKLSKHRMIEVAKSAFHAIAQVGDYKHLQRARELIVQAYMRGEWNRVKLLINKVQTMLEYNAEPYSDDIDDRHDLYIDEERLNETLARVDRDVANMV